MWCAARGRAQGSLVCPPCARPSRLPPLLAPAPPTRAPPFIPGTQRDCAEQGHWQERGGGDAGFGALVPRRWHRAHHVPHGVQVQRYRRGPVLDSPIHTAHGNSASGHAGACVCSTQGCVRMQHTGARATAWVPPASISQPPASLPPVPRPAPQSKQCIISVMVTDKTSTGGFRIKVTAVMINVHAAVKGASWGYSAGAYADGLRYATQN